MTWPSGPVISDPLRCRLLLGVVVPSDDSRSGSSMTVVQSMVSTRLMRFQECVLLVGVIGES